MANTHVPTWERIQRGLGSARHQLTREPVTDALRRFFKARGFREVETPLFLRCPGMEPHLDAFASRWRSPRGRTADGFLATSPEYAMKKLLAAGIGPLFQICKSFRNGEDVSSRHNPEFTILEWYRPDADYRALMDDCEALFRDIAESLQPATLGRTWTYQGKAIDLQTPWERLSVRDAFQRYAGVEFDELEDLVEAAERKGYVVSSATTGEQAYHQIFLTEIEPHLGQVKPTFLYDYPIEMAALARASAADPSVAERFELYVAGIELANAFSELVDAQEQRRRLLAEREERRQLGKVAYEIDEDFLHALELGMPPSAGIALGVDRLVMFFADTASIQDVLWFPASDLFPEPT